MRRLIGALYFLAWSKYDQGDMEDLKRNSDSSVGALFSSLFFFLLKRPDIGFFGNSQNYVDKALVNKTAIIYNPISLVVILNRHLGSIEKWREREMRKTDGEMKYSYRRRWKMLFEKIE